MAFWNKGDDPWDRKPGQTPRPAPRETETEEEKPAPLLDRLEDWSERRRAEKAKQAAEQTPAPIPCPWCGKPTETGYIMGGRGVWWAPGIPGAMEKWVTGPSTAKGAVQLDAEGGLSTWQTAWRCRDCKKLIVDCPDPPEPTVYDPMESSAEQRDEEEP